jgi:hypothetical protein
MLLTLLGVDPLPELISGPCKGENAGNETNLYITML